jgi:hypothetical protein
MKTESWAALQARQIRRRLAERHGAGWHLLSVSQQRALVSESVLELILGQLAPEIQPAIELARSLLAELTDEEN